MISEALAALIDTNLPAEIHGFTRRTGDFETFGTIIYSTDANLLLKNFLGYNLISENMTENLLYEVSGNNLEECYLKMIEKIDLNRIINNDFCGNALLQPIINFWQGEGINKVYVKLFEVYIVIDINSGTQFFCIATVNPIFEYKTILRLISEFKNNDSINNSFKVTCEDYDTSSFPGPRTVHLYSYDFKGKKEEIRSLFEANNWVVIFKDKACFEANKLAEQKTTILCEGKNYKILNKINIPNIRFSEEHNSVTIFQNVKTRERYCLRDKDYLFEEEINRIKRVFPKYYILDYYCIENYLYHPDNIEELNIHDFCKEKYIADIIKTKNNKLSEIIEKLDLIRKGYREITENHINPVNNVVALLKTELTSNDFETFYKHFDMKNKYKKQFLSSFSLTDHKLASTNWFKNRMTSMIA